MKLALRKLARLSSVDLQRAINTRRRHPLWNEEIHIEEELINLHEMLQTNRVAGETLREYPSMHRHFIHEQRDILHHTIGLIARMLKGDRLPREYTEADTIYAITRLTRLIVAETLQVGRKMDEDVLDALKPFLSLKQRLQLREWGSFSPRLYLQLAYRRLVQTYLLVKQS